jgi:hypothetical protein
LAEIPIPEHIRKRPVGVEVCCVRIRIARIPGGLLFGDEAEDD